MDGNDAIREKQMRKWLCSTGKADVLDFSDSEIAKLKECFLCLDQDQGGSIGIDELEEPLIGLGFADSRDEVIQMIDEVDDDKTGEIEFGEFL